MSVPKPKRLMEPSATEDQTGHGSDHGSGEDRFQPINSGPPSQFVNHTAELYCRHVIIVEDEPTVGYALELELEEAGAVAIGPATSLLGALEHLDNEVVDGAILDIDLNGVDVFPLADILIERGICFVFHTAHGRRQELRDVYPGVPICSKPSNATAVLQALGKAFADRARN